MFEFKEKSEKEKWEIKENLFINIARFWKKKKEGLS